MSKRPMERSTARPGAGDRAPARPCLTPAGAVDARVAGEHTDDTFERSNNAAIERLREKTQLVKAVRGRGGGRCLAGGLTGRALPLQIALDIETEVQAHNRMLNGMVRPWPWGQGSLPGACGRIRSDMEGLGRRRRTFSTPTVYWGGPCGG
jgi:hypothetical protein